MECPHTVRGGILLAALAIGLMLMPGCGNPTPAPPAPTHIAPAPLGSAQPHRTGGTERQSKRSAHLPDYFPNDYVLYPDNGFSYLEVPGADGRVSELHAFSSGGNARFKIVFLYDDKGRIARQLEFAFGSENDNMLEKEYVWKGDTATWKLSDRNREVLVVDAQHRVVERTLGVLAIPYAYLHVDYDNAGRSARIDRFYKTDSTLEVLQTRYEYADAAADWSQRTAHVYRHHLKPDQFRTWDRLKAFIRKPDFEAGPFTAPAPYQKILEVRTAE